MGSIIVPSNGQISRGLHAILWILQIILAVIFMFVGSLKLMQPTPELVKMLVWTIDLPMWLVRAIGAAEMLGAAGLILPALTGILPFLTRWAAGCLALLMLGAVGFHLMRGEYMSMILPGALCLLSAYVFWGRCYPVEPK